MKKIIAITMALIMIFAFAACSSTEAVSSENADTTSTSDSVVDTSEVSVKLGFLTPTLQNDFFIALDEGLAEGCEEKGWEYVGVSFDGDSAKAVTSIENMVTAGCNVILAMVSDTSCDGALEIAKEAGVIIIECGVETEVHDVILNADQYGLGEQISEMAADWINNQLAGKANIVIYTTYQNVDMQNRGQGIEDKIKEVCPDSTILEVVDIGKDVVGIGTTTTETMMQKYPELNCILCYTDAAAVESVEAVKSAGKNDENFGIFSCDGTESALQYIASGDVMRGSVKFAPIAPVVIEYAQRALDGETFTEVIALPGVSITAENISDYYTK